MKNTAHLKSSQRPAPESEQSSIRRRDAATVLGSAQVSASLGSLSQAFSSPADRGATLATKLSTARALQRRLPMESREAQLLAIAVLRRDEALLDELIRRTAPRKR